MSCLYQKKKKSISFGAILVVVIVIFVSPRVTKTCVIISYIDSIANFTIYISTGNSIRVN